MNIERLSPASEATSIETVRPAQHVKPTRASNLRVEKRRPTRLQLNLEAKKASTARSGQHQPKTPDHASVKGRIIVACKEVLVMTLLNRVRVLQMLGYNDEATGVLMSALEFYRHCPDDLKMKTDMWCKWFDIDVSSAGFRDPEQWRTAVSFPSPQANFQLYRRVSDPSVPTRARISLPARADIRPPSLETVDSLPDVNYDSPLVPDRKTVTPMMINTTHRNSDQFPAIPTAALRATIEELDKQPTAVDETVLWLKGVSPRKPKSRDAPDLSDVRPVAGNPTGQFAQMLGSIRRQNDQIKKKLTRPIRDARVRPDSRHTKHERSTSSSVDVDVTTISPLPVRRGSLDSHQSQLHDPEAVTPLSTDTPALSKLVTVKNANPTPSTSKHTTSSSTTATLRRLSQDSTRSPPSLTLQTSPSIHHTQAPTDHTVPLHHSPLRETFVPDTLIDSSTTTASLSTIPTPQTSDPFSSDKIPNHTKEEHINLELLPRLAYKRHPNSHSPPNSLTSRSPLSTLAAPGEATPRAQLKSRISIPTPTPTLKTKPNNVDTPNTNNTDNTKTNDTDTPQTKPKTNPIPSANPNPTRIPTHTPKPNNKAVHLPPTKK